MAASPSSPASRVSTKVKTSASSSMASRVPQLAVHGAADGREGAQVGGGKLGAPFLVGADRAPGVQARDVAEDVLLGALLRRRGRDAHETPERGEGALRVGAE